MIEIKVAKDFTLNDKHYIKGDLIKDVNISTIAKLNAKGFIEPLTYKDLVIIERELNEPKKEEKE